MPTRSSFGGSTKWTKSVLDSYLQNYDLGKNKLLLVETVSEKGSTFYEAHFRSGLRTREIKVDANGNQVH